MNHSNMIALSRGVVLDAAVWDNKSGMTVKFSLAQTEQELGRANPFKKFTKMRKGRVGTIFAAVITSTRDDRQVVELEDDIMLKGWTDGTSGWTVTFWLDAEEHPFLSFDNGEEFHIVLVELADDGSPIDQNKRDVYLAAKSKKDDSKAAAGQKLSNFAALLCKSENFRFWAGIKDKDMPRNEGQAAAWMREKLRISSRSELDSDEKAADRFHRMIRRPYAQWLYEEGINEAGYA